LAEQKREVRPAAEYAQCPSAGSKIEIREQTKEIKGKTERSKGIDESVRNEKKNNLK
jgi:hypothetical protein